MKKKFLLIMLVLTIVRLALPSVSLAAPTNDDFVNATTIGALPFSDSVDISTATTEPNEPQPCNFSPQTVWYSFTPSTNGGIRADIAGSSFFDTLVRVYRQDGSDLGGLAFVGCASPFWNNSTAVTFNAAAGTTYYIQAGSVFGNGGNLALTVEAILPPANDNFVDATTITVTPFSSPLDLAAATIEPGEPTPSCGYPSIGTAWYAFTPSVTQSYVGNLTSNTGFGFIVDYGVYTGGSLQGLQEVACHLANVLVFRATAGTTYYIQVANGAGQGHPAQFTLDVAPPPVAGFGFSPGDPSIFDTIHFFDQSSDPAGADFASQLWQFGDGITASGCCPTHQYAIDGDYTVQLTVTTVDGRTASTSQVVHVKTHDVAITKFGVPTSASAGQTRTLKVGVNSKRNTETVQVELLKGDPINGGYQLIGTLTQSVPVRAANRTTDFDFSYTFTQADASIKKVTFKAIATVLSARDAIPADNEAVAAPTKINR